MEDIQGVSGRRDLISRLSFLRSGILADDMACTPAACRTRHDGIAGADRRAKTYQTQPSNSHVTPLDLRGQQTQHAHLSDQASTCTDIRREERESVTLTWHITGHAAQDKDSQPASQPTARYLRTVTICRGEQRA